MWTVTNAEANVAVIDVKGSRLVIRGNTLSPGQSYEVLCQVYKFSNGDFITQVGKAHFVCYQIQINYHTADVNIV